MCYWRQDNILTYAMENSQLYICTAFVKCFVLLKNREELPALQDAQNLVVSLSVTQSNL